MAVLIFYEKPGCITNAKKKRMLKNFAAAIEVRSILEHHWTKDELHSFLSSLPVAEWINKNAPDVKSGAIKTSTLTATTALDLMLEKPLLIRRPLIEIGNKRLTGFNLQEIANALGIHGDFEYDNTSERCSHGE